MQFILSLFPGLGLLDIPFEELGACIVRGPDVIWGGDVRRFHPPKGIFDGVIAGPPCQSFTRLAAIVRHNGHQPKFPNLIPEFERCVAEAQPAWFLMENVPEAPTPHVAGYITWATLFRDYHVGGRQPRKRRFSFGTADGRPLDIPFLALHDQPLRHSVIGHGGPTPGQRRTTAKRLPNSRGGARAPITDLIALQGLPPDHFKYCPFTSDALRDALANGVPLTMGRAVATAVLKATETVPAP